MKGRWEVFIANVLVVAEEAMAMWVLLRERLDRSSETPGRGLQSLKSAYWALTFAVHSS